MSKNPERQADLRPDLLAEQTGRDREQTLADRGLTEAQTGDGLADLIARADSDLLSRRSERVS